MDEKQTLRNLLQETGLAEGPEFASADGADKLSPRERHFLDWGHDKIKSDAVLFQHIPVNNSCFPLAYFRRLQDDNPKTIAEAHRLAWNMGRAPLLFLVLPGKIRVHSAFEAPRLDRRGHLDPEAGLIDILNLITRTERERQKMAKYRREELLSGRYWELDTSRKRFSLNTRVEKNLMDNLKAIRTLLISALDPRIKPEAKAQVVHSLLGRSIFIQYLQDRKDNNGYNAFPKGYFDNFNSGSENFADVLAVKKATYNLFDELAKKFNGDIFPVTNCERDIVKSDHLSILAQFLRGTIQVRSRQLCFWPLYSFDAIPIEFISNMYEEFFHYETTEAKEDSNKRKDKDGTYYTPHRLVEFLLDEMLPWEDSTGTLKKVLDPSCGSGIFLVEAYRRLINRWQQANSNVKLDVSILRKIMTDCLFGVDKNLEAIRVAAFSLCLTMCDYLEPRYIWNKVQFPNLREKNLWEKDFFEFAESPPDRAKDVDLVIGNPPWESNLPESAKNFLAKRQRVVGDKQIAQAFLWAAPEICKKDGQLCLVAPSKSLLFNASGPNRTFRKQFFSSYEVDLIVNFSALRRTLFAKAIGPAAPIVFRPVPSVEDHKIAYCCPKPWNSPEDCWNYVISNTDIQHIPLTVALENPYVWKTAMWGGPRDWQLIARLTRLDNLAKVADDRNWTHAEGFIVGKSKRKKATWLTGQRYLPTESLRKFSVDEASLSPLEEELFHSTAETKQAVYRGPHVLFGQAPKADRGFVAALLQNNAVFRDSIVGISGPDCDEEILGAVCIALLTDICRYTAMMTSSKWLVERDELQKCEVMFLPLPAAVSAGELTVPYSKLQQAAANLQTARTLLEAMEKAYGLDDCELVLVKDAVKYELEYFRSGDNSQAAKPADETMLRQYAEMLSQSLTSSFTLDGDGRFSVTVYVGNGPMLAANVLLKPSERSSIEVQKGSDELQSVLSRMDNILLEKHGSGLYVRRDVHVYQDKHVCIAKRNQRRLWTRAAALRDADNIYADVMSSWGSGSWG